MIPFTTPTAATSRAVGIGALVSQVPWAKVSLAKTTTVKQRSIVNMPLVSLLVLFMVFPFYPSWAMADDSFISEPEFGNPFPQAYYPTFPPSSGNPGPWTPPGSCWSLLGEVLRTSATAGLSAQGCEVPRAEALPSSTHKHKRPPRLSSSREGVRLNRTPTTLRGVAEVLSSWRHHPD